MALLANGMRGKPRRAEANMTATARQLDYFLEADESRAPAIKYKQYVVGFSGPEAVERRELEHFIYNSFQFAYGATVKHFMPTLVSLRNDRCDLLAACGVRRADAERLFLEAYLDAPVEEVLSSRCGRSIAREGIIEVGNFAAFRPGMARHMIAVLASYIQEAGTQWIVFTATAGMRNAWSRLGIELLPIGEAIKERLEPGDRGMWGSYYDSRPRVMAGNVSDGCARLLDNLRKVEIQP
jgi:hypothetical protein